MKASKMRDMSKEDLLLEESELRKQLLRLRFQTASGQLESAPKMRTYDRTLPGSPPYSKKCKARSDNSGFEIRDSE